jgi:hypothetical protein
MEVVSNPRDLVTKASNAFWNIHITEQRTVDGRTVGVVENTDSLWVFTEILEQLFVVCQSDPSLIGLLVYNGLVDNMVTITNIYHCYTNCDIVCLDFLALVATTEKGANCLQHHIVKINYWVSGSVNAKFSARANPIVLNLRSTLELKDARSEQRALDQGNESLDTLELGGIGILFGTNRLIRRRVVTMPQLYRELPREQFCGIFPKGCPGCVGLNLICAAEVIDDSTLVLDAVGQMLNDPDQVIFNRSELQRLRRMSKLQYRRKGEDYPYMGNCLDFGGDSEIVEVAKRLGELIVSKSFSKAMETDREKCVNYASERYFGRVRKEVEDFCASILLEK